jgi:hypothetical protein
MMKKFHYFWRYMGDLSHSFKFLIMPNYSFFGLFCFLGTKTLAYCEKEKRKKKITAYFILVLFDFHITSLWYGSYRLCLTGGKEVHNAVMSSIYNLAKAFSSYQDEVLVKT